MVEETGNPERERHREIGNRDRETRREVCSERMGGRQSDTYIGE